VTLKAKYSDFRQVTRSRTVEAPVATRPRSRLQFPSALLEPLFPVDRGIRLLGVTLSSLVTESEPGVEHQPPPADLRQGDVPEDVSDGRGRTTRDVVAAAAPA